MANTNLSLKTVSLASYNMHGYNQGCNLLKSFCDASDSPDFIPVQEHWLSTDN